MPYQHYSENGETELEGVWKFPQVPDNISLNSYDEDTDATDVDSTLGTPLPDSELSFFDPLSKDKTEGGETTLCTSKSWLFDAINTCAGKAVSSSLYSVDCVADLSRLID